MTIDEIRKIALTNQVPIILDDTRTALTSALQKHQPKRILEIGSGVGYSGLVILNAANPAEKFVSVEKNRARYLILKEALPKGNCTAVWDDAYNALAKFISNGDEFDFVFLDGPKAQYGKYFNLIHKLLPRGGVIFADNVDFHGMVSGAIPATKGAKTIVAGLTDFREKLTNFKYQTEYLPAGDGIITAIKT